MPHLPDITTLGIDADDTLWQSEQFFKQSEQRFAELMAGFVSGGHLAERLLASERKNLKYYGFGIKGFVLSMIETAIEVSGGSVTTEVIGEILKLGHTMHDHPVVMLPGVVDTLRKLSGQYRLVLITKGDLFDQERKLAQSGLAPLFEAIEIVSDKSVETYQRIFANEAGSAAQALMIGNSLKSDILPALAAGAGAVFIPHPLTWAHEQAEPPLGHPGFFQISGFSDVLGILNRPA